MKKYLKVILAAIVGLVFISTFVFLYMKSKPQPVVYDEFTPKVADINKTTVITGTIEPRDEVEVKPQISGIITEIYKEAGDKVDAGEVLVSAEEYDNVRQALDQAHEEKTAAIDALEVVRDGVSSSNASASSTLIRSTISGLILDVPVKVGNSVILSNTFNDGTTIATVADMGDLIFKGNIDETEVGQLVTGMQMKITIGALQNLRFDASLEYISPKATDNNGANQFEIKAAVSVPQGNEIRSGYSANAEIVLASARGVLTVPESAIEFSGDDTYVYVVKGQGDEKTYERRKVVTGLSDGVNIEIRSGLKKTDRVRGPQKVAEE